MDEYVRRSYKYAYADSIEVGRLACLPEPPDLKDFILFDAGRLGVLHYYLGQY